MNLLQNTKENTAKWLVYGITFLICGLVVVLNQKWMPRPETTPVFVYSLPLLNAILNGTCSLLLVMSLWAIRNKKTEVHKTLNLTAFALSALFLISYVTAHYFISDTRYGDTDHNGSLDAIEKAAVSGSKPFYLILLITHITLAIVVLPMVMMSFYYGLKGQIEKHRKLTRFSYPIWLYVTISGVLVYVFISPYYPF
ncbi:MAG TPA: DUF420 domain-containing protein [Bacteroidia bacterium]|nr:DUF420 domain-containing protein [Bacteroidia bacterium]